MNINLFHFIVIWMLVWKIPILTNIFQRGWNQTGLSTSVTDEGEQWFWHVNFVYNGFGHCRVLDGDGFAFQSLLNISPGW